MAFGWYAQRVEQFDGDRLGQRPALRCLGLVGVFPCAHTCRLRIPARLLQILREVQRRIIVGLHALFIRRLVALAHRQHVHARRVESIENAIVAGTDAVGLALQVRQVLFHLAIWQRVLAEHIDLRPYHINCAFIYPIAALPIRSCPIRLHFNLFLSYTT